MAAYLLLRPHGDAGDPASGAAAAAYASTAWVVAHVCGALAVASVARLGVRLADLRPGFPARLARWSGLAGATLVLPYYGAETFGLHAIGARVVAGDATAIDLVLQVRSQPVALTMLALGLVLLTVCGIAVGRAWQRGRFSGPAWAAWPLGGAVALFLPQFFLPPVGRMAYGVGYLVAALLLAAAAWRSGAGQRAEVRDAVPVAG